jgi:hypothetical protein
MGARLGGDLGIPQREWIGLRIIALVEAFAFLGLLLLAAYVQPVWLSAVVFVAGLFASGGIWIVALTIQGRRHTRARKILK